MKKLTLLFVAVALLSGGAMAKEKSCCKKEGKCAKEAACCKDKKNCKKECSKEHTETSKEAPKAKS